MKFQKNYIQTESEKKKIQTPNTAPCFAAQLMKIPGCYQRTPQTEVSLDNHINVFNVLQHKQKPYV